MLSLNYHRLGGAVSGVLDALKLLYFSSEIISKSAIEIFQQNPININAALAESNIRKHEPLNKTQDYVYEFLHDIDEGVWFLYLRKYWIIEKSSPKWLPSLLTRVY